MLEAYTMFMFLKDLPYKLVYIQAHPLSYAHHRQHHPFYKEECENEAHNLIPLLAEAHRETPLAAWWDGASRLTRGYFVSSPCTKECIVATKIS